MAHDFFWESMQPWNCRIC